LSPFYVADKLAACPYRDERLKNQDEFTLKLKNAGALGTEGQPSEASKAPKQLTSSLVFNRVKE
jgi:hypothetical protein